jgi:N-acetylmuramoyl-L-alanine amidase
LIAKLEKMAFKNPWGKGNSSFDRWFGDDPLGEKEDQSLYDLFHNPDEIFVTGREQIVVYVDPGHSYGPKGDKGNRGAQSTLGYKHKVPKIVNEVQVPDTDKDNNEIEKEDSWEDIDTISTLKYIKDEVQAGKNKWVWTTEWVTDPEKTEHNLVYKIGNLVYLLLIQLGYTKTVISRTAAGGPLLKERIDAANKLSSDYYLAIHSDGDMQYRYSFEECSAIYYPDADKSTRQEVYASYLMSQYTYSKNNKGATISRNQAGVVSSEAYGISNPNQCKSIRRTIVELGVTANPSWFDNALSQKREIAKQLVLGLEANIKKYYFKRGKIIGYEFDGKTYKSEDEIPYANSQSVNPNITPPRYVSIFAQPQNLSDANF